MLSKRTLIISPLISIGAVTTLLVGAAYWLAAPEPPAPPIVYEQVVYANETPPTQNLGPLSVAEFPDYFQGYFHWDGETRADQQSVGLDVHDVGLNDQGLIVATGRATYNTNYRNIDFTFRIEVNPDTNEFVMWESEPNKSGFVTTGRHVATIANFDDIDATWIGDDGDTGVLKLWPAEGSMRFLSDDSGVDAPRRNAITLGNGVLLQKGLSTGASCVSGDSDHLRLRSAGRAATGHFVDQRTDRHAVMPKNMIPGLRLALLQMCEGETARVYIPADMAHKDGYQEAFAPGGHVMFDLEVIDVEHEISW